MLARSIHWSHSRLHDGPTGRNVAPTPFRILLSMELDCYHFSSFANLCFLQYIWAYHITYEQVNCCNLYVYKSSAIKIPENNLKIFRSSKPYKLIPNI